MAARTCSTVRDSDCVYLHLEKQSQIQNCFRDIQDQRIPKSDYLRECQGQACSKLILSTCLFHSCLPSPEKWKSDANLFKKYSGSKNTQICLAYSMPRAGMLQTNILYIFFFFFFIIYEQKVRHQSFQEILRIKEYSNVIDWEDASQGKAFSKLIHPACFFH